VHQLSASSFNALLKSIEEPPAHVVFMMATTELHKIPDTILSRSQVFEFRTIALKAIVEQMRKIATAEQIEIGDDSLGLIARAAEGSMRDAQSALDQVLAFSGQTVTLDDVVTVLGLVGRDLLFDLIDAVADEDGPRAFALADRAVESGHDLKLVCRELTRVVRDIMMASVDPARAGEGELAEGERARLTALAGRFSREDLMRAFDLLAKCEQDIRVAAHPRYHFEMAMLKWMHLRRLVPLTDLIEQMGSGRAPALPAPAVVRRGEASASPSGAPKGAPLRTGAPPAMGGSKDPQPRTPASPAGEAKASPLRTESAALKDALLAEIRGGKGFFYNTVIAQAQSIEVAGDKVTFAFLPTHRALRDQLEQNRAWIEAAAERVAGRKIAVVSVQVETGAPAASVAKPDAPDAAPQNGKRDLKAEAMSSAAVQAVLDVFPGEIKDVEEL
jgi:DNA polymerase-3 subunit gamma/tau